MNNVIEVWYVLHACTELDGGEVVTAETYADGTVCNSAPEHCSTTWWHTEEQHLKEPHQIEHVDGSIVNLDKSYCFKEYIY